MNERGQLCGSYLDVYGPFFKNPNCNYSPNNSKLGFTLLYHEKSQFTLDTQGHIKNPKMGGPL